jgi:hypothetical protein
LYNPQLRLRLALASIALAAIALALLLAFASISIPRAIQRARTVAEIPRVAMPVPRSFVLTSPSTVTERRQAVAPLWTMLAPWALAVDAIAVVGFVIVLRMWRR